MQHTEEHIEHTEAPANMKAKIWRTFWILLGFTIIDIAVYFMLMEYHSMAKNFLFIILGIVKAYFIVGIFMHMKFERKWLPYLIITPMVLVIYFITLMVIEGGYTSFVR
jgi:cytochrome c oxidase subunit 4